ncbi:MAG: hypothetical protein ACN6O2_00465 [Stenotrophomonas sp.]
MHESLMGVDLAVKRATLLNRRLMSLVRQEEGAEQWFDVGKALTSLLPMIRQLMGAGVKINGAMDERLPAGLYALVPAWKGVRNRKPVFLPCAYESTS